MVSRLLLACSLLIVPVETARADMPAVPKRDVGLIKVLGPGPDFQFDTVDVRGALRREQLRKPLRATLTKARACAGSPKTGSATLSFSVMPDGVLVGTRVKASSKLMESCLAKGLAILRFPGAGGTTTAEIRVRISSEVSGAVEGGVEGGVLGGVVGGVPGGVLGGGSIGRRPRPARKRGSVRLGKPRVQGGIEPAVVHRYMRRRQLQIRYCYDLELTRKPTLRGTLQLRFVLDGVGRVMNARALGLSRRVASCVERTVKRIRFPKITSAGTAVIRYSIRFRPLRKKKRVPVP